MFAKSLAIAAAICIGGNAFAETIEVKMLNKGAEGSMVFEPAYIAAQPGDVIRFISTDKGHNVESIKGMLPEGVEKFKSKLGADYDLQVDAEGLYGVKCTPHYALGMVALIQVGGAVNLEEASAVKQKGKAKKRFEPLFGSVQ
ncbi:Pseudoazurin precursor [Roseovarius albus]|uniref:Pseudoazurin n=1 Tax=Roseovarius albus TaxID=1247867 RepID=A0A1X6ZYZ1_9RHOB|nr:pseudoazurin [Roseovarius albus]SLN65305.1 Pseudoazurin precursor [Roseovarius albus]